MWIKNTFFVLFAIVLSASCTKNKGGNSTGNTSEILVVCYSVKWAGAIGDTLRSEFMRPMDGLPQEESGFGIVFVSENNFSKALHSHHSILIVDIDVVTVNSKVETLNDEWSQPQRVVKIRASSDTAFFGVFAKHLGAINELFNQNERAVLRLANAQNRNSELEKYLNDEFGIAMTIPNNFVLAGKSKGFLWLQEKIDINNYLLMVYTFPYSDTAQLNPAAVLANKEKYSDFINKSESGDLIATNERYVKTPVSERIVFKGMCALKTSGSQKSDRDSLDCPFINYTIVDAPRKRIVVFDGIAFPQKNPIRSFIRQFESIIWEAEFSTQEQVK